MQQDSIARGRPDLNGHEPAGDAAAVLEEIRSGEIKTVIAGGCDLGGLFRAKRVAAQRFAGSDEPAVEFSEYLFAMDIEDYPQPRPAGYEGWWPEWASGFGDILAIADLGTLRRVPWLERTAIALCSYRFEDGREYEAAPRNVLTRVIDRCERLGLQARFAPEYEFVVFRENEESAIAKDFRDLRALAQRPAAYGAMQATIDNEVIGRIVDGLEAMRVPVDVWAPEGAPGQYELNLPHAPALEAADLGFLFKHGVKEICALNGLMATFMPKIAPGYGSSLHVHQSIWRDGESAFYDADAPERMSKLLRHFVAGQLRTLRAFTAIWLPTPPAFKRFGPYSAAGTTQSWGFDNKTLSLRVLTTGASHCRVEHRSPGADANVYLVLAAMLAGGLYGIENELELPPPTQGDAYADPTLGTLPATLEEAVDEFEQSEVANEYLGAEFVSRYAATRRWEVAESRKEVTDWELRRYFMRV